MATKSGNKSTQAKARRTKKTRSQSDAEASAERFLEMDAKLEAISKCQAMIEFGMDGTILTANENFLATVGYALSEVQGRHHSMFVDEAFRQSAEYKEFWEKLNRGEYDAQEYRRIGKGGKEVWIQASYNPILDLDGKPFKVVKFATDVTDQKLENANFEGQIEAINKAQAVIEFEMDGTILTANAKFLATVGYELGEVQGRHHSMFVDEAFRQSLEYKAFWEKLNRGEYEAKEYKRIGKGGEEIWIQASYNPILDLNGKPFKVVKFATDVTRQKLENANFEGQIEAVSKAQAVIEFEMDGTILTANENFLATVGYTLNEVQGRHHSMFVDDEFRQSAEYKEFWEKLNRGEYEANEYKRLGKGGKEVWIQATYNPILDLGGKPFKVVKFATDITEQKLENANFEGQIDAVSKAQAVIEFEMDGTILTANENFLTTVGYSLSEVQGRHHSMFVDEAFRQSAEYKEFWQKLNRGEYEAKEYKRIGRGGKEVWIQATYNPILDLDGRPFKVVKFATDITPRRVANAETARFVGEMSGVLTEVAEQNLTARVAGEYGGDHATTKENLNRAVENLERALGQVGEIASQLTSASRQINQGSTQVAEGASSQASSIEEISASLQEMSAMTAQSADNAMQASGTANAAAESVVKGAETMQEMQAAIQAIKDSSTETAKIVKTIDEISFQTNMLALNAAVEAARAGDAGKGFAVVAEEVRALAQRSAEAAKMTAQLIDESSRNASNGVKITTNVRTVLDEINGSTVTVRELLTEMAAASKEQAEGIGQINSAVDQMNKVTQDNAATSEQSSAAAGDLDSQISRLSELLGTFTLCEQLTSGSGVTPPGPERGQTPAPARVRPSGVRPQQVFPLDDDELGDF